VAQIQVRELARKLAAGEPVHLVDVRQPWEAALATLPGSLMIPLAELKARHGEIHAPPGTLIVVYCHHGIRSLTAAALLHQLGVADAVSLAGGIDAWSCEVTVRQGALRYVGRLTSGWGADAGRELARRLAGLRRRTRLRLGAKSSLWSDCRVSSSATVRTATA
jgi:adenylyltransferase/sulfurtransferase